ncbi:Tigger transposable element-derived protein 6 [Dictyocoela muelleri]|nr:Tigger transposable element-derived protein 6 [Dictyocoela muelleri]
MCKKIRKILLLLDNVSVHPKNLYLGNIELLFLPPNTTSRIQPLDQGIIKAFKDRYRKYMLSDITRRIETDETISFESKLQEITVLDAIMWSARAWSFISKETVINCFEKGISNCFVDKTEKTLSDSDDTEDIPAFKIFLQDEIKILDEIIADHFENSELPNHTNEPSLSAEIESVEITSLDAFKLVDVLERYYLKVMLSKLETIWKVKQDLETEIHTRPPKITDFFEVKK